MFINKTTTRKFIAAIVFTLFISSPLFACTTFVIKDSTNLVFGRNFDWDISHGFLVINQRGLTKKALVRPPYKPATWVSEYGSITFNQIGIDAPMGGMNEKGLVIAQMALFETKYPEIDGKNVLNDLEWIQYQQDISANLNEVIENTKKIDIDPQQVVPVHYLICDSQGNMGVVEFIDGKLVVIGENDMFVPVCSNMPYKQSLITINEYRASGGPKEIPEKWNTVPDIIAIANSMIMEHKETDNAVDYGFKVLKAVGTETRTQWSIVFDIKNKKINYRTLNNKSVRTLNLDDYNFACANKTKTMDVHTSRNGIILPRHFKELTYDSYYNYKLELLNIFKANFKGFLNIPESSVKAEVEYALNRNCN